VTSGADINDNQEGRGTTPLILASQEGHIDVVECLLSLGADTEVKDEKGMTALMIASLEGKFDVVRLLLDHGADPLLCDKDGKRAIDLAASSPEIQTLLNGLILLSFHHHHVP